jgi:peroxiredoxin
MKAAALPTAFGLTLLTNDVVWWLPFAAILYNAARISQGRYAVPIPADATPESMMAKTTTASGKNLRDLSFESPVMLVFLRHFGCTFCKQALADLARDKTNIEFDGTHLVLVHMGDPEQAARVFSKYRFKRLDHVADPGQRLYQAFGFKRGTFGQLFGPGVIWKGLAATLTGGHGVGRLEGDGFQLPGIAFVYEGKVTSIIRHRTAAERFNYTELAACPLSLKNSDAGA